MRALYVLFLLGTMSFLLGASSTWTEVKPVRPACSERDKSSALLVGRRGYHLACMPGGAVVKQGGQTYKLRHSACFNKTARMYFGIFRFGNLDVSAQNSLYLVLEPYARAGRVQVVDGSIEIVTRKKRVLSGAVLGEATVDPGLRRGTFSIVGLQGAGGKTFTGSWHCG